MFQLRWGETFGTFPFTAFRNWHIGHFRRHTHDFAEIFWIEEGHISHFVNEKVTKLGPGDVVMIRPDDYHGFEEVPGEKVGLTGISFRLDILEGLRARYFSQSQTFFWSQAPLPWTEEMSSTRLLKLNEWAEELKRAPREAVYIDRFLLNVLIEFSSSSQGVFPAEAPDWLVRACQKAPQHLAGGVEEFVHLCGRSREHVARTMRRELKTTPTEYINKLRMEHAQHHLAKSSRDIVQIALDCGLGNLGHFYTLFRRATGMTPHAYRMHHLPHR